MIRIKKANAVESSFRDPSGRVINVDDQIFRLVHFSYSKEYSHLMDSGLYADLVFENLLIAHKEIGNFDLDEPAFKVLQPKLIPFISYPSEWSFNQLKDAALLTLRIQAIALKYGMTLKDCSAYNVQFYQGKPIFIDTLSFSFYEEGGLWTAYKQFCEHFLIPLAVMAYTDLYLSKLYISYIDGIPLSIGVKLLPLKKMLTSGLLMHVYLHNSAQKKYQAKKVKNRSKLFNKNYMVRLCANLMDTVNRIQVKQRTVWKRYYEKDVHSTYLAHKTELVNEFILKIKPVVAIDLGANNGLFSRLLSELGVRVFSLDSDPICVNDNYTMAKEHGNKFLLPLVCDILNPTPAYGWANKERESLLNRIHCDVLLALAIVHHLAISNNIPISKIVQLFSGMCENLIIEFVPKNDSKVEVLLQNREDVFHNYNQDHFEEMFSVKFDLIEKSMIRGSDRILYYYKLKIECA